MAFFLKNDVWSKIVDKNKEVSEFLGIDDALRKDNHYTNTLFHREGASTSEGSFTEKVFAYNWLYWAVIAIADRLKAQEKPEAYEKLTNRLDELSGWLASRELQQVLEAKVKSLESTVERLEKKLAKLEKSD